MHVQMRESDHFVSKNMSEYSTRDSLALGIFILDEGGIIRYCNERLLRRIETSFEKICGQSIKEVIPDFPADVDAYGFGTAVAVTAAEPKLIRMQLQNGGVALVRFTARPLLHKGRSSLVVIIEEIKSTMGKAGGRDIASLIISLEGKVDAMLITDTRGNIEFVNRAFELMTGFNRTALIGRSLQEAHLAQSDADHDQKFWEDIRCGKSLRGISIHCKRDGTRFYHEQSIRPFYDLNGAVTHAVFTGQDVTQRLDAMRRLSRQANYDSLTGLPNRNLLADRLRQVAKHATRSCEGFVLAMLDVDGFKAVNDAYGHSVGDLVLCRIARRVESCLRNEDTLGRLGGDEFVLILPGIGRQDDAEEVINKIIASFSEGFIINEKQISVSVSIGIAIYPCDGEDLQGLLDIADKKMYRDKEKIIARHPVGLRN